MFNKFYRKLIALFRSLPYAIKGGDVLVTSNKESDDNLISVERVFHKNALIDNILRGEVTKEVEELRYSDYNVSRESTNYKYIGDGKAVKTKDKRTFDGNISFSQNNKIICEDVLHELERVDSYGDERYTLKIKYKNTPRFKLEKYCTRFSLNINKIQSLITLYFNKYANEYDITSRQFINELKLIQSNDAPSSILNDEEEIMFTTYKASNEDDLVTYKLEKLEPHNWGLKDGEYYITFVIGSYEREDLVDKFYSKEMDEKYKTKAKKTRKVETFKVIEEKQIDRCSKCGVVVDLNMAEATKALHGQVLCKKCAEDYLL